MKHNRIYIFHIVFAKEILNRDKIDKIRPMSDFLTCKTYSGSYAADGRFAYPGLGGRTTRRTARSTPGTFF